jgi:hypothetical protein
MGRLLKVLKGATEVLTTAGAVLAAAIVVVETYQVLRKRMDSAKNSGLEVRD